MGDENEIDAISAFNKVVVEDEAELGNKFLIINCISTSPPLDSRVN